MKKLLFLFSALLFVSCSGEDSCEPTPKLTTSDATEITDVSANVTGTITPPTCDATVTSQGFVYGKSELPTIDDTKIVKSGSEISVSLNNLQQNNTYYVRTFFENPTGLYYGNEVFFSTNVGDALVQTNTVFNIFSTNAMISGAILSNGGGQIISKGFCFSIDVNPTVNDQIVDGIGQDSQFEGVLENLTKSTLYYIKAYAENESGVFYGSEKTFETINNEQRYSDGTATDQEGNTFEWINYGSQDWAIENAEVVTYSDGTAIPQISDATAWANLTTGAWCYYDNDPTKGKLYNWYAIAGIHDNDENTANKEFAPQGWRVPSYDDWIILEDYLIGNRYNYDQSNTGNKIAKAMASTTGWNSSTTTGAVGNDQNINNRSGFNAVSEGYRFDSGSFVNEGDAVFWSSTESSTISSWGRFLTTNESTFNTINTNKRHAFSVRFARDN